VGALVTLRIQVEPEVGRRVVVVRGIYRRADRSLVDDQERPARPGVGHHAAQRPAEPPLGSQAPDIVGDSRASASHAGEHRAAPGTGRSGRPGLDPEPQRLAVQRMSNHASLPRFRRSHGLLAIGTVAPHAGFEHGTVRTHRYAATSCSPPPWGIVG